MVQFLISTVEFLATIALSIFGIDYTPEINCEAALYEEATSEIIAFVNEEPASQDATGTRTTNRATRISSNCFAG
jgi:hypothetical protein